MPKGESGNISFKLLKIICLLISENDWKLIGRLVYLRYFGEIYKILDFCRESGLLRPFQVQFLHAGFEGGRFEA